MDRSHGSTALLRRCALVLPATEAEQEERADEGETYNGADNNAGNPGFGASTLLSGRVGQDE